MASSQEPLPGIEPTRTGLTERLKNRRKGRKSEIQESSLDSDDHSSGHDLSLENSLTLDLSETNKALENSTSRRRRSNFFSRRKKREAEDEIPSLPGLTNRGEDDANKSGSEDEGSLGMDRSVGSSNVTEDSEDEAIDGRPERPLVVTRDSHAGYLTHSSPLITSHKVGSTSSLPPSNEPAEDNVAPKKSKTLGIPTSEKRRASSPGKKLKEAFVPKKSPNFKKTDSDTSISGASSSGVFKAVRKKSRSSLKSITKKEDLVDSESVNSRPSTAKSTASSKVGFPKVDTDAPPVPPLPGTPPNIVEAPTTLVTPPTPTRDSKPTFAPARPSSSSAIESRSTDAINQHPTNPNIVVSPSGNMISHRRARSSTNPPSKLSKSELAPLTPTLEETKTPGGTITSPSSGFFSSVFSAAQNATTSLSSSISNPAFFGQKHKSSQSLDSTDRTDQNKKEEASPEEEDRSESPDKEKRKSAVDTLGAGDLTLGQLGIADESPTMASTTELSRSRSADVVEALAEDNAAAKAVSDAYLEKPNGAAPGSPLPPDGARSPMGIGGAETPPKADLESSIRRTGSVRSKLSGGARRRRQRHSSGVSGNTIAAAITASNAALSNPTHQSNVPRLTGFAVASIRKNKEFHQTFRSVPEDDYLIEDYSAALQRDILLHGRFYVSEGHICFSSNILGWVTNLVISFDEVVSIEKKSTAVIFPNAIVIHTLHARNVFASFVSRDSTYDLLIGIWKISHPNLKSSVNGVMIDNSGTGDRTSKAGSITTDDGTLDESEDEVYDEDAEEEEQGAVTNGVSPSANISEAGDPPRTVNHKASTPAMHAPDPSNAALKAIESPDVVATGANVSADFPGPSSHGPTDCGDGDTHYDKVLMDAVIPAPLGKIYSLMFGPGSGAFMKKFLVDDQKSQDLQMEDDGKGLGDSNKTFSYTFIKPLNAAIGPKQTKCIINQTLQQFDLEKGVTIDSSTSNPDVPNGNIFLTKTKYCLMWAPNNGTRLLMTCTIEWSGRSFIKGAIEKGTNDGQLAYAKDLVSALRAAVSKPTAAVAKSRKGKKGRKSAVAADVTPEPEPTAAPSGASVASSNWGLLEPIHAIVGPIADPIMALIGGRVMLALLLTFVTVWYMRRTPTAPQYGVGIPSAQRVAAYEEMWRGEESALWEWLEDRVGTQRVGEAAWSARNSPKVHTPKGAGKKPDMDEAIRVTEEKLRMLKDVHQRKSSGRDAAEKLNQRKQGEDPVEFEREGG